MRIKVPLTGTVKQKIPCILGNDEDPIRPVKIDLGNVSWTLTELDLENELMEIEVTPAETVSEDTGEIDERGKPVFIRRPTTAEEKAQLIERARNHSLERKSKEALYALSGSPRLKNPFKKPKK